MKRIAALAMFVIGCVVAGAEIAAQTGPEQCASTNDCASPFVCTRDWNRGIQYQLDSLDLGAAFGHCVDPTQSAVDDDAPIQADLDVLQQLAETTETEWNYDGMGIPYHLPDRAQIRIANALEIRFRILLNGNGAQLRVENNASGIVLSGKSSYSRIQDLAIQAVSTTQANTGVGIDVKAAAVRLYNLRIIGMGTGIQALDAGPENVNLQRWRDISISSSDADGVRLNGNDANAGLFSGLSITGSGKDGLHDSGFLGSTFVGLHLEQNAVGLYTDSTGASRSTFVGTYIENSDAIYMSDPGSQYMTIVGGQLAARSKETAGDTIGARRSRLGFEQSRVDGTGASHTVKVLIPNVYGTQDTAALEWTYEYAKCSTCAVNRHPRWHLDRNLDVGSIDRDAWEIRPTLKTTSIKRSVLGWESDTGPTSRAENITMEIERSAVCGYIASCP